MINNGWQAPKQTLNMVSCVAFTIKREHKGGVDEDNILEWLAGNITDSSLEYFSNFKVTGSFRS